MSKVPSLNFEINGIQTLATPREQFLQTPHYQLALQPGADSEQGSLELTVRALEPPDQEYFGCLSE